MKRQATLQFDLSIANCRKKCAPSAAAVLAALFAPLFAVLLLATSANLQAQSASVASGQAASADVLNTIRKRLMNVRPDLVILSAVNTPVRGLYQAQIENGPVIYTTADGAFFLTGDLFAVRTNELVNLAEEERQKTRVARLASVKESEMIVFAPKVTKASVTVFTDIDCGYCQKLHREVPELNKLGVEVRYLAYPRAGVGSDAFSKLVTAWCADDKKMALTRLKNREALPPKSCANPVARQFELGQQFGISGTPALITDDGRLLPGYMPAAELAARLGIPPVN